MILFFVSRSRMFSGHSYIGEFYSELKTRVEFHLCPNADFDHKSLLDLVFIFREFPEFQCEDELTYN